MRLLSCIICLIGVLVLQSESTFPLSEETTKTAGLQRYKDVARPLLVFAPKASSPGFQQELRELRVHPDQLRERGVVVLVSLEDDSVEWRRGLDPHLWPGFSAVSGQNARRLLGVKPGEFVVVLIGKDGGRKVTQRIPLSVSTLSEVIDAMPMRQQEVLRRKPE